MRISDWSSDVCSSDLLPERIDLGHIGDVEARLLEADEIRKDLHPVEQRIDIPMHMPFGRALRPAADHRRAGQIALTDIEARRDAHSAKRSEEHTSELQSLMRISYAVFCLKNKTHVITY